MWHCLTIIGLGLLALGSSSADAYRPGGAYGGGGYPAGGSGIGYPTPNAGRQRNPYGNFSAGFDGGMVGAGVNRGRQAPAGHHYVSNADEALIIRACTETGQEKIDYKGDYLIKFHPTSRAEVEKIVKIDAKYNLDFWNEPRVGFNFSARINKCQVYKLRLLERMEQGGIHFEVITNDVSKIMNRVSKFAAEYNLGGVNLAEYPRYNDLIANFKKLANAFPDQVELKKIGKTWEKRDLYAVKLIGSKSTGNAVILECGVHSREWASVSTAQYIAFSLMYNKTAASLLDHYDLYIIPSLNPDGYEYTHNGGRTWRKTRSRHDKGGCIGVDANRNFAAHHCDVKEQGASLDPCDDSYCGPSAFSESESAAVRDLVLELQKKGKVAVYFSLHAFSQYFMYPWGYTKKMVPNADELEEICQVARTAIKAQYGNDFTCGAISHVIYVATGSSIDWAYDTGKIPYAFAVELRPGPDADISGFMLPANQIIPAAKEFFEGFNAVLTEVYKRKGGAKNYGRKGGKGKKGLKKFGRKGRGLGK